MFVLRKPHVVAIGDLDNHSGISVATRSVEQLSLISRTSDSERLFLASSLTSFSQATFINIPNTVPVWCNFLGPKEYWRAGENENCCNFKFFTA